MYEHPRACRAARQCSAQPPCVQPAVAGIQRTTFPSILNGCAHAVRSSLGASPPCIPHGLQQPRGIHRPGSPRKPCVREACVRIGRHQEPEHPARQLASRRLPRDYLGFRLGLALKVIARFTARITAAALPADRIRHPASALPRAPSSMPQRRLDRAPHAPSHPARQPWAAAASCVHLAPRTREYASTVVVHRRAHRRQLPGRVDLIGSPVYTSIDTSTSVRVL